MLLVILLALAFVVGMAPASLVDGLLERTLRGEVRLADAHGTVWNGGGKITVRDPVSRQWHPWFQLAWTWHWQELLRAHLGWRLQLDQSGQARVSLGLNALAGEGLKVRGPAEYFWQRVPGPLAKFAWGGDLLVSAEWFECAWDGVCAGRMDIEWTGAASDFLPGLVFGSYKLHGDGQAGRYAFSLDSAPGSAVRLAGSGTLSGAKLQIGGTIQGDPVLLKRLPAVAHAWVRPTQSEDTWEVHYP